MKHFKIYLIILFVSIGSAVYSQNNFAINTTGTQGNPAAILDLSANTNLGMLLPNVSLTSLTSVSPFTAPPAGLIVYNTNASMPYGTGFYYWSTTASSWYYITNSGTAGAVTSVGLSMPSIFTVTGSPVTSSGTLTGSFVNENANLIFAGPSSGSPATPSFRALVLADLPTGIPNANLANSTFTFTGGTGISVTGSPVALGGTVTITGTGGTITSVGPAAEGNTQTAASGLTFSANPITTGAGTISLAKSGVTVGTYGSATTIPGITVNAEGQITSETTYTPSVGTVTSVTPGTPGSPSGSSGLTFSPNPITTTGTIAIATGGVTNAMLANPSITVNAGNNLTTTSASIALGGTSTIGINTPVTIANGGTGTTTAPTPWGVIYASTATTYASTAAGAASTVLAGNGAAAPTFQTIAAILGNGYIKNQTTVQTTANFNIQSAASGSKGGVIEGATGQTADLMDFDNSTPAVLASVGATGNVTSVGLTTTGTTNLNTTGAAGTAIGFGGTGAVIIGNATGMVGVGTTTPVNLFNVNGAATLGQASTTTGLATFYNSANTGAASIQAGSLLAANSYTLTLPLAQGAANSILTNNGSGVLSWASAGSLITANNGLTETGSTIQLGGPLVQNTVVNASASNYTMAFDLGTGSSAGTGTFAVNNGGTTNPYIYVAKSTNGASVGIGNNAPGNNLLNVSTSTATSGTGNGVALQAQTGAASNAGGAVAVAGGAAGSNASGGAVTIAAGTSTGNAAGNNVIIHAGALSTSGTNGGVAINNSGAAPNAAALVDMTSTSAGLLIPRIAYATNSIPSSIIAAPTAGLLVFNTTTGCFDFYNGTSWQAMTCSCYGAPGTPTAINGLTTICINSTSITYTVSAVSGATGYTWSLSSGTITAGQGTSVITVTAPGSATTMSVSVMATNPCGSSSTFTLPVTVTATGPSNPGSISGSSTPACSSTGTYTIGSVTGATYYLWTVPAGVTITSGQGSTSVSLTFVSASSGSITCTPYTFYPGGCPSSSNASLSFTIQALSAPAAPAGNSVPLVSTAYTYTIAPVTGATSYTWSTSNTNLATVTAGQGSTSATITNTATTGTYNICVYASNACLTSATTCTAVTTTTCVVTHGTYSQSAAGAYTWSVPCGITQVTITLDGAEGGLYYSSANGGTPGNGAQVVATLNVSSISSLNIYLGGVGGNASSSLVGGTAGSGGNGGDEAGGTGYGGFYTNYALGPGYGAGGGGGGASSVRVGGTAVANIYISAGGGGGASTFGVGGGGGQPGVAGTNTFGVCTGGAAGTSGAGGVATLCSDASCALNSTNGPESAIAATNGGLCTGGNGGMALDDNCYNYGGGGGGGGYGGGAGGDGGGGGGGYSYTSGPGVSAVTVTANSNAAAGSITINY